MLLLNEYDLVEDNVVICGVGVTVGVATHVHNEDIAEGLAESSPLIRSVEGRGGDVEPTCEVGGDLHTASVDVGGLEPGACHVVVTDTGSGAVLSAACTVVVYVDGYGSTHLAGLCAELNALVPQMKDMAPAEALTKALRPPMWS